MSDIKWIKLSVGMFDDEKIKLIRTLPEGDSIVIIWVQILCLAGKINDGGAVYMGQNLPYSDEMLATILDHPPTTMTLALRTLEDFGMIDRYGDGQKKIEVTNWEKHQSTDKMAQIKQQNRVRQQKHYYRSKLRQLNVDVDSKDFPNDLDSIKEIYEQSEEEPNVRLTLPNATEVRGKKKEVRGKKKESTSSAELTERFEKLWKLYPRKQGKKDALKHYKRAIKEGTTDQEIERGIKSYIREIKITNTKKQFIRHGSAWFNQHGWEDEYLGGSEKEQKDEPTTDFDDLSSLLGVGE